jgi:hypothetical protein
MKIACEEIPLRHQNSYYAWMQPLLLTTPCYVTYQLHQSRVCALANVPAYF